MLKLIVELNIRFKDIILRIYIQLYFLSDAVNEVITTCIIELKG